MAGPVPARAAPRGKDRLFDLAFKGLDWSGAHRWGRRFAQGQGAILTLHHVRPEGAGAFATNQLLEIAPGFLDAVLTHCRAEGYDLISLDELPSRLKQRQDRFFICLTFDDGYRDNIAHAMPVLAKNQAPWTMFVCAGFADRTAMLWWLELELAIRALPQVALDLPDRRFEMPAGTEAEKAAAFDALYWTLRTGPEATLLDVVGRLSAEAGCDWRRTVAELCLDWDELRALSGAPGVTMGAHTLTHPLLARLPLDRAREEIVVSRARIEGRLERRIDHFAYPVGDRTAADRREFDLARQAGFVTAVTTRPGHVTAVQADLMALPRVSLNGFHQNLTAVKALLSGLPFLALRG